MSLGNIPYTLVGFAAELNWRPLIFDRPLPRIRICCACGLVRPKTAVLSCMHVLCGSCYDQCTKGGSLICPLDDLQCPDADVEWKEWSVDELLKREVTCWNKENGCDAVMGASELSDHFQSACSHHTFPCPRCSAAVLCKDACVHLRSHCDAQTTPFESERRERSSCNDERAILSSLKRALEEQVCEMRAYLERVLLDSSSRDGRLNEICHSVDVIKETLRQERAVLRETLRDELGEGGLREEMNALKEGSRELLETLRTTRDFIAKGARDFQASSHDMKECLTAHQTYSVNASNEYLRQLQETVQESRRSLAGSVSDILVSNEHMKECLLERMEGIENLCGALKTSSDAMKAELITATKWNTEKLGLVANAVEESAVEVKENCRKSLEWTKKVRWLAEMHVDHCVFFVQEVKAHTECAVGNGVAYYFDEPVYVGGYCISPGVTFMKAGRSATIHVAFILCKGYKDDPVMLPSGSKIKLSFIHPVNNSVREMVAKLSSFPYAQMPVRPSNGGLWFMDSSLGLEALTRNGYLHGDRLRVRWELLL